MLVSEDEANMKYLDPFVMARKVTIQNGSELQAKFNVMLTKMGLDPNTTFPLIATPGDEETGVLNATKDHVCACCKKLVWLSPSSKTRMHNDPQGIVIVCKHCLKDNGIILTREIFGL